MNKETLRAIKFALFSISAGIIQIVSFTLLNELTPLPEHISYLIALVLSVLWNFTFNRRYTFQSAGNVPKAMLLVALFYCVFTPRLHLGGENPGWDGLERISCHHHEHGVQFYHGIPVRQICGIPQGYGHQRHCEEEAVI